VREARAQPAWRALSQNAEYLPRVKRTKRHLFILGMFHLAWTLFLFATPSVSSRSSDLCTAVKGKWGQWRPLLRCVNALRRRPCPLSNGEDGVCCPHILRGEEKNRAYEKRLVLNQNSLQKTYLLTSAFGVSKKRLNTLLVLFFAFFLLTLFDTRSALKKRYRPAFQTRPKGR